MSHLIPAIAGICATLGLWLVVMGLAAKAGGRTR
jgi:hypothetical protein